MPSLGFVPEFSILWLGRAGLQEDWQFGLMGICLEQSLRRNLKPPLDQAVESVDRKGETPSGWSRDGVSILLAGPWLQVRKGECRTYISSTVPESCNKLPMSRATSRFSGSLLVSSLESFLSSTHTVLKLSSSGRHMHLPASHLQKDKRQAKIRHVRVMRRHLTPWRHTAEDPRARHCLSHQILATHSRSL